MCGHIGVNYLFQFLWSAQSDKTHIVYLLHRCCCITQIHIYTCTYRLEVYLMCAHIIRIQAWWLVGNLLASKPHLCLTFAGAWRRTKCHLLFFTFEDGGSRGGGGYYYRSLSISLKSGGFSVYRIIIIIIVFVVSIYIHV